MSVAPEETEIGGSQIAFRPTLWTDVLKARDPSAAGARESLERLIRLYWKPVYFFIRRKGRSVDEAKDLTQEFFTRLLDRSGLAGVDRAKGKFRSYLLGALQHFLSDASASRLRHHQSLDLDFEAVEKQFRSDQTFERDWALTVMERAFVRLKEGSPREAAVARVLRGAEVPYRVLAQDLGITEANVKVLVHRARHRLREILLEELRATVGRASDARAELADLFEAFSP